jgi:pyruvate dehydrogenase E2 component (dihydrolipoamide acetyltransferase)
VEAKNMQTHQAQNNQSANRVFASPLARRIAHDKGIDLTNLKGTGPRGRIVKADVESAKAGTSSAPSNATQMTSSLAPIQPTGDQKINEYGMVYSEIPNNNIKKITASRLQESKQTVPHFYLTVECQIDELMRTRTIMNDAANGEYKLSVNDFVVKACANALKAFPKANVAWTDDAVRQYIHSDISVAVSTPNGLITPIVKQAELKGLKEISAEVKDLAARAREGKLKPEEFQGGTFSVSNLGMFGVKEFGAIINPPQACILAVGAGEKKPYVDENDVKIGTFMSCTLSVDHRAVDGAVGAEYLQVLKRFIENPAAMLL